MQKKDVYLYKVDFAESITVHELSKFRGVMAALSDYHPLFHNHSATGYRYSYPKIQYKLIDGRPCVLGVDEGAQILAELLSNRTEVLCTLGRKSTTLHVSALAEWHDEIALTESRYIYNMNNWLPLNAENFREYRQAQGMIERLSLLQRILKGNILSFAKGMDIFFEETVDCVIEDMDCIGCVNYKGVDLMSFSGVFCANVSMPQWIGLGKSASLNHGTIIRL